MWFILSLLRLLVLSPLTFSWASWGNMGYYEIILMWKQSELKNPMYWVFFIYQRFSGHLKRIMKCQGKAAPCVLCCLYLGMSNLHQHHLTVSIWEWINAEGNIFKRNIIFLIGKVKFIKEFQRIGPRTEKGSECTQIKQITDQAVMVETGTEALEQLRKWKEANSMDIHMN